MTAKYDMSPKKLFLPILLLVISACSHLDSSPVQPLDIPSIITQAVSTAQTAIFLTQVAMSSNTPNPTSATRPPIVMKIYDDFEDQKIEGSTSSIRWLSLFNSRCKTFQRNGVLVISDTYKQGDVTTSSCDLIVSRSYFVPYDEIGIIRAKLMAKKQDGDSPFFWQTISLTTHDIKNGIAWDVGCGITANEFGVHFVFRLYPADLSQMIMNLGWQAAKYDTWYQVKMELDADTNTIKCFIDENLFYETIPPRLDEIQSSDFFWALSSFTNDENPYTELWFDNVYIGR